MGTPHKWADVIKAWADGADVQISVNGSRWEDIEDPAFDSKISRYRIKPEPKPDVVYFCIAKFGANDYLDDGDFEPTKTQYPCDNLKLTFDGETKKLKSAEVINND